MRCEDDRLVEIAYPAPTIASSQIFITNPSLSLFHSYLPIFVIVFLLLFRNPLAPPNFTNPSTFTCLPVLRIYTPLDYYPEAWVGRDWHPQILTLCKFILGKNQVLVDAQ